MWLGLIIAAFVFVYLIRSILLPFVLGVFAAYFLDPVVDRMQRTRLGRGSATSLVLIVFFLIITLLCLIILPILGSQLSGLLQALPGYTSELQKHYSPLLNQWLGSLPEEQIDSVKQTLSSMSGSFFRLVSDFVGGLLQSGMAFVNILSLLLITPVVAFYLLRDWDHITQTFDRLLPRAHIGTIREQLAIIDATLAGFLRGQINVCLLLGTYYALGLSLVGLHFGIVVGIATGFLVIFPYVGLMLGMGIGLTLAFFQFDSTAPVLAVLGVFISGQIIEGNFVTPKLVGDKVGLHPVWIIFGMLSGAALFGFVGILLAVPVTAVIGVLIRFTLSRYLASSYYHGAGPKG